MGLDSERCLVPYNYIDACKSLLDTCCTLAIAQLHCPMLDDYDV